MYYSNEVANHAQLRQERDVGNQKPVPSPQYVSVGKTSTTQTMSYEMSSSMGYPTQTSAVKFLGPRTFFRKPVNDVIALVENKEMARNALPSSTLSAVSSFKR